MHTGGKGHVPTLVINYQWLIPSALHVLESVTQ